MSNENPVFLIRDHPRKSAAPNPQATDSKTNSQDRPRPNGPAFTRFPPRKPVNLSKLPELLNVPTVTTSYSLTRNFLS
jgi:hypothetical protein